MSNTAATPAAAKTKAPLRLGYVGCGFMAQKVHLPNIVAAPGVELKAIAEVRPQLGETVRRRFNVETLVADHRQLAARKDIDAVCVSGHFSGQGEIAIDLLTAGKDVFMEKPMAVSVAQAERILAAEKSSGRRLMIAYMKRYDAGNLRVKSLLEQFTASGELGNLQYVRNHGFGGDWIGGLDTPFDKSNEPVPASPTAWPDWLPAAHQNGYMNYLQQYTHNVNLLRWFLNGTAQNTRVKAVDLGADGLSGIVVLEINGTRAVIESGWVPGHTWDEHTQVFFNKGWLKTEAPVMLLRNTTASVELYRADQNEKQHSTLHPGDRSRWAYAEEIRHFVTCLQTGQPFHSTATDTLNDVAILEEIYKVHTGVTEPAAVVGA